MYNILLIKHLPTRNVAVARVVGGKHATTAGRMRNTNNGTKGTEVFNTIWGNTVLRGNLFPEITDFTAPDAKNDGKSSFISKVKDTSNSFYNFIKVK